MGCNASTLVEAQPHLHVTCPCSNQEVWAASLRIWHAQSKHSTIVNGCCLQMIVLLLEAPGNITWSEPAAWAGTAVSISKQVQQC